MLIPLRDINPTRSFPFMTILLIAANAVVFIAEITLPSEQLSTFFTDFGLVPARFIGIQEEFASRSLLLNIMTLFTCMFVHGGWMHVIGNMWILWLFGNNVEDELGHFPFLVFYLIAGLGAGMGHLLIHSASAVPTVGASGAVAGVMGAYVLLYPRARIKVLFWFFFIFFRTFLMPAWIFIGFWFATQVFFGLGTIAAGQASGIAFWAHIVGFIVGVGMVGIHWIRNQ